MDSFAINFIKEDKKGVIVSARLIPNSSKNMVVGIAKDYVKIKITAPALENKANKQLLLFLSELLKVPKSKITLIAGAKARIKRILISDFSYSYINDKFSIYDKIDS